MKIFSIMWHSYCGTLKRASKNLEGIIDVEVYSSRYFEEEPEKIEAVLRKAESADVILLFRSIESIWEMIEKRLQEIGKNIPIICVGHDPSYWVLSTVRPEIVACVYNYIVYNGEENFTNMLKFLAHKVCKMDIETFPPKPTPWEGLYHPDAPNIFSTIEQYLKWYSSYKKFPEKIIGIVGLLISRFYWVNENMAIEDALTHLPIFSMIPSF